MRLKLDKALGAACIALLVVSLWMGYSQYEIATHYPVSVRISFSSPISRIQSVMFGSYDLNATCVLTQTGTCDGRAWSLVTPVVNTRLTYPVVVTYLPLSGPVSYCRFDNVVIPGNTNMTLTC